MALSFGGQDAMARKIRRVASQYPNVVEAGLYIETQIEVTEIKRRTPVDRGTLRGTIHSTKPMRRGAAGGAIYILVLAGGPSAPYAIYVHEDLEALHTVGQAKYMESVILESQPSMAARVARRIQLNRMVV